MKIYDINSSSDTKQEKNSEWYQIITQDIADQREHYDLQMYVQPKKSNVSATDKTGF